MPPESLNAPEDLIKEAPRQVAFGHLQGEVARVADEAPAGLEESLLGGFCSTHAIWVAPH